MQAVFAKLGWVLFGAFFIASLIVGGAAFIEGVHLWLGWGIGGAIGVFVATCFLGAAVGGIVDSAIAVYGALQVGNGLGGKFSCCSSHSRFSFFWQQASVVLSMRSSDGVIDACEPTDASSRLARLGGGREDVGHNNQFYYRSSLFHGHLNHNPACCMASTGTGNDERVHMTVGSRGGDDVETPKGIVRKGRRMGLYA
jgi:hypothetical protein